MSFGIKFQLCTGFKLFFCFLFLAGCAQQPLYRGTRQPRRTEPSEKISAAKAQATKPSISSTVNAAPILNSEAVMAAEILPKLPINNIAELKKNITNEKISTDLIENKLSSAELETVAGDSYFTALKPQLLLKIGRTHLKNRQPDRAAEYFRSVAALFPQSTYATQANVLLSTIHLANDVDAKVIGAILPLTGKNASLGQHALNAIRMGLDLNNPENKFRLALFDSQSNPEHAATGVDKLIKEDKAIVLLGGFTAREAASIATRAELLSTPYFGFSQKSGLTNIGDYVFRNSVTPEMQVDKLVQFAFEKLGAKKFAILFPNDSYGVEFSSIFWDHILAHGGEITAAQTYDPKETDFTEAIQKLVGTHYVEARSEEYETRVKELKEQKEQKNLKDTLEAAGEKSNKKPVAKKNSRDHWSAENVLPPIVDFDVLFVPDSSRALGQILAFMSYNDVKNMKYLGTNIWNSPDLPKRAANHNSGVYFVDAIDISQTNSEPVPFFKEYLALYKEAPTLVEIQAYEVARIVKEQIKGRATSRESLASSLRSMGSSDGVTGQLRMSSQRELERPIHVLTLDSGILKKIE